MHPFYGPGILLLANGDFWLGLASMAMYLLFWAVVIFIAIKLFKKYIPQLTNMRRKEDTALSILRERYARGEIDAEEFRQKKEDLT